MADTLEIRMKSSEKSRELKNLSGAIVFRTGIDSPTENTGCINVIDDMSVMIKRTNNGIEYNGELFKGTRYLKISYDGKDITTLDIYDFQVGKKFELSNELLRLRSDLNNCIGEIKNFTNR